MSRGKDKKAQKRQKPAIMMMKERRDFERKAKQVAAWLRQGRNNNHLNNERW